MEIIFTQDYTVKDSSRRAFKAGETLTCSRLTGNHFVNKDVAIEHLPSIVPEIVMPGAIDEQAAINSAATIAEALSEKSSGDEDRDAKKSEASQTTKQSAASQPGRASRRKTARKSAPAE